MRNPWIYNLAPASSPCMKAPLFLLTVLAYLSNDFQAVRSGPVNRSRLAHDDAANLGGIGSVALTVAAVIIGAVVSLVLLSALFPTYSGAVGNLSENVSAAD